MPALIITLSIDAESQQFFNQLRNIHFPAHANFLDAHITLFHRLPLQQPVIEQALPRFAQHTPIKIDVNKVSHAGNWVAYALQSDALQQLHLNMQQIFAPWLTRQDAKILMPHITVQNKVTAWKAQQLYQQLQQQFTPFQLTATGLQTWLYQKGPWKVLNSYPFAASP